MKPVGIDHFADFQFIGTLKTNGEGLLSFLTKKANIADNRYDTDLWILQNGRPLRLTSSGDIKAHWWQGTQSILFSSLREAKDKERAEKGLPLTVLYSISTSSPGEAAEWLRLEYSVQELLPLPDGRLLFTAEYNPDLAALLHEAEDEDKAASLLAEEKDYEVLTALPFWRNGSTFCGRSRTRLYLYSGGHVTALTDEHTNISNLQLAPSGQQAFFLSTTYTTVEPTHNQLMQLCLSSLATKDISIAAIGFSHQNYVPLSDTSLVVAGSDMAEYGLNQNCCFYRLDTTPHTLRILHGGWEHCAENTVGTDLKMAAPTRWATHNGLVYWNNTLNENSHLMSIHPETGHITQITRQPGAVLELAADNTGLYISAMRGLAAAEIFVLDNNTGEEHPLTALNTHIMLEHNYARPEALNFTNSEGVEIQGWVMRPVNWREGEYYPTILNIHGGPKTVYGTVIFHEMQYWAGLGFGVIFCNPTGGDGRGAEFADIRGRYGLIDYDDIMAFTDAALAAHDWIDQARLGVTGGSYGGFMTNWIIGHTGRFKAAVSQRSISNWVSMMNTTDIGYYFAPDQTAADPWTDIDAMWEQSPLKYANRVTTPTLFIHSDEDYRCWMAEALQMYTALQIHGVETRLCLFHGENHELSRSGKPRHRIRRLREITAWFEKYLQS